MLWIFAAVLVVLWWLGLLGGVGGPLVHALLVFAAGMVLYSRLGSHPLPSELCAGANTAVTATPLFFSSFVRYGTAN